jgi:hypothetical protein
MSSCRRMPMASACALAVCAVLAGCALSRRSSLPLVDATAPATAGEVQGLHEFQEAMRRYVDLRNHLARGKPEASPGSRAAEIRQGRGDAKQGDLFRRGVQPLFRRALTEELRDPEARDTRRTLGEGNPETAPGLEQDGDVARRSITLVVNGLYPPGASFSTMPPRLLQRLPALPASIDYRFVGRDLVLVDTTASLVIDYLPNAVPVGP